MHDEPVAVAFDRRHALVLSERNLEVLHDRAVIRERVTPRRLLRSAMTNGNPPSESFSAVEKKRTYVG